MRVYLRSIRLPLTALSSQANFTFCQRTDRLKGTNIGFGYYFFLRPSSDSIALLDLSPRNKLYAQNRYSAVVYAYNRVNHFLHHTGRNIYNTNLTHFKFIIKILDINTYQMKKILQHD